MGGPITKNGPAPPARTETPALDFGHAWDYAPAPEAIDHVRIEPRQQLFIGGAFRAPRSGKHFDTVSPSTEQKLA
jgi:aldehyde dehydrogenase (NAD+)